MKKILLQPESNDFHYYRANLHCHSTLSDGRKTPQELKEGYQSHGYQILCITDHDIFIPHNNLSEPGFLMLNGTELDVNPEQGNKTCHMCFISLDEHNENTVCWHRNKYVWGNAMQHIEQVGFDDTKPDFERLYSPEGINAMIKEGIENNFFVTYNHPTWSLETYEEYTKYKGFSAMEIQNFGCVIVGYDDDNGHCYEDMLRNGERLYAVATDDNHNIHGDEDPNCDSYGGYIMVGAKELTYKAIAEALKNGRFYASCGNYKDVGPVIKSITYENGKVSLETSEAAAITVLTNGRYCRNCVAKQNESVTHAEFTIPEDVKWFRFTVTDLKGHKAYTNAYFTDEL